MITSPSHQRREDGSSAVEYGLLAVAIAAVITLLVFLLGTVVSTKFTGTCNSIQHQMTSTDC